MIIWPNLNLSDGILQNKLIENTILLDEHWLWTGKTNGRGYGRVYHNFNNITLHRLSAYLFLNLDLNDSEIQTNHKNECPYKNCWNPEHLYVGTQGENIHDSIVLGNHRTPNEFKTHCKYGHEFNLDNTYTEKDGTRQCRQCRKDAKQRYEDKIK